MGGNAGVTSQVHNDPGDRQNSNVEDANNAMPPTPGRQRTTTIATTSTPGQNTHKIHGPNNNQTNNNQGENQTRNSSTGVKIAPHITSPRAQKQKHIEVPTGVCKTTKVSSSLAPHTPRTPKKSRIMGYLDEILSE
jgi:hypothetical protein